MNYRIFLCLLSIFLLVGIVNADTLLVYPATNGNGLTSNTTDSGFSEIVNGIGDTYAAPGTGVINIGLYATTTNDVYDTNRVYGAVYNTSAVGSGNTIIDASLCFYSSATGDSQGLGNMNLTIASLTPTNLLALGATDYNKFGSTVLGEIAPGSWSHLERNCIPLNAAGLSYINKTGLSPFAITLKSTVLKDSTGLTWASGLQTTYGMYTTGYLGTSRDPYMNVTWTVGGATPPVASFTISKNFIRIPGTVTATDTSTNTPTSWEWSWGDGSANSTTQNPVHQYLKRGKWDIVMTAMNAGGSGTTGATSVRVVGYENYY